MEWRSMLGSRVIDEAEPRVCVTDTQHRVTPLTAQKKTCQDDSQCLRCVFMSVCMFEFD